MSITQLPPTPKIKHLISFGPGANLQLKKQNSNNFAIRNQQSFSFDYERQANSLGLNFSEVTEHYLDKNLSESFGYNQPTPKVRDRIQALLGFVRNLKKQLQDARKLQLSLMKFVDFRNVYQVVRQLQAKQSTQNQSSLLSIESRKSQTRQNLSIHKTLTISIAPTPISPSPPIPPPNSYTPSPQQLLYQLQLKQKQIKILNHQLSITKQLSSKKDSLTNEKLRLKEQQWQRKLNDLLKQFYQQNRHQNLHFNQLNHQHFNHHLTRSCRTQGSFKKEFQNSYKEEDEDVVDIVKEEEEELINSVVYKFRQRCHSDINEQEPEVKEFRVTTQKKQGSLKNWRNLLKQKQQKQRKQFKDSKKPKYEVAQKLKPSLNMTISHNRDRKKSADLSYEQARIRINNFENSLKTELCNITAN